MARHSNDIPPDYESYVVERPDGFYWIDPESDAEFGPFATAALAIADMESGSESDYEPGESLAEAEAELGISDWIDPETGAPGEDFSPRLED